MRFFEAARNVCITFCTKKNHVGTLNASIFNMIQCFRQVFFFHTWNTVFYHVVQVSLPWWHGTMHRRTAGCMLLSPEHTYDTRTCRGPVKRFCHKLIEGSSFLCFFLNITWNRSEASVFFTQYVGLIWQWHWEENTSAQSKTWCHDTLSWCHPYSRWQVADKAPSAIVDITERETESSKLLFVNEKQHRRWQTCVVMFFLLHSDCPSPLLESLKDPGQKEGIDSFPTIKYYYGKKDQLGEEILEHSDKDAGRLDFVLHVLIWCVLCIWLL